MNITPTQTRKAGAVNEDCPNEDKKEDREGKHYVFGFLAQILSNNLRESDTTMPERKHSGHIVMYGPCENAPEDNPKIGRGAEFRTHDGPEDRSGTCYVQELDHENLPGRHHDVIYTIRL